MSVWMVAVGSLLGGLGGVAAVVTLVRDFDNPIAQAILDDKSRLSGNRKLTRDAYKADEEREAAAWKFAVSQNTSDALSAYIARYPAGRFVAEAVVRRNSIVEDQAWRIALQTNTVDAFSLYLAQYPIGPRAGAARANIQRISKTESGGKFSLESVDQTARPAVISARALIVHAEEAQRAARRGQKGYLSQYRSQSDGVMAFGGQFEGRIVKNESWSSWITKGYTELGIWKFDRTSIDRTKLGSGFWTDVVEAKGRAVSVPNYSEAKFSGELVCYDGRRYQGDFEFQGGSFAPGGYGALWASDGTLIGSGRWTSGKMRE